MEFQMKRLLLAITIMTSFSVLGELASVDVSGTFINSEGCRAYQVYCTNFQAEDDDRPYNRCSFELYKNGKRIAHLGKGGKIVETIDGKIIAKDRGFRSTLVVVPEYKNVTATFHVNETYSDPTTFPETSIASFDLEVKKGLFGKKITCKDMVFEEEQ